MNAVNKSTQATLDLLFAGLTPGQSRRLKDPSGTYMDLSVERLSEDRFSLAHYFEQNGDLVPDPDMELWRGPDGRFYPVATQFATGYYARAILDWKDGAPHRYAPAAQRDAASFLAMWLRNVRDQQRAALKRLRAGERWAA